MARFCYCNKCGKQLTGKDSGWMSINDQLGYGSKYDMEDLQLDLCYNCLDMFIDSCKIKPVTDHGGWSDD